MSVPGVTTSHRILVAGVGNIFLADDGFGVEVARRMAGQELPEGVQVVDFGIRGVHLAFELLEAHDLVILVDATPRGEPPGTVCVIEPDLTSDEEEPAEHDARGLLVDAHSMEPAKVLAMVEALDGEPGRILVVGCEPLEIEERIGLSSPVEAAVDPAIRLVRQLVEEAMGLPPSAAERGSVPVGGARGIREDPQGEGSHPGGGEQAKWRT